MKPEDALNRVLNEVDVRVDPCVDRRILQDMLHRLKESAETSARGSRPMRRKMAMRNPIVKLAVAAAVVVAAAIGMHFFDRTSNPLWAAALEKVLAANTCVYRIRTVETTGPRPDDFEFATETQTTVYRSDVYGVFNESLRNGELYTRYYQLFQANECVGMCYPLEQYTRRPMDESQIHELNEEHPQKMVAKVLQAPNVELGEDIYEGKRTVGVELRKPAEFFGGTDASQMDDFTARVWVDVETQLPVLVYVSYVKAGSSKRTTVVLDEFQWDVSLDAGLFEPNIPAHFAFDVWESSRPDSTPRTQSAEQFAANTQAEPYLGDFGHVPLPDLSRLTLLGLAADVRKPNARLLSYDDICEFQDAAMVAWPPLEQVRGRLCQELQEKLGIDRLGVDELVGIGIVLRERFWEAGGSLSRISYPYAYAARIVTEMAHEKAPRDLAVTDQLVESIATYAVTRTWHEDENRRVPNPIYPGRLTQLRLAQFAQIKNQVAQGLIPTWKDFVRAYDLGILLGSNCEDYERGAQVVRWLIDQAPRAGWTYYLESLTKMEQAYLQNEDYRTGLFLYGPDAFPQEYQYSRRLFSFQGPRERSQSLVPIHLRHIKSW